ncbi:Hypothetical predicted protein [Mytilus galloprovincialis]|uniref:Uncharacterized protein n=1 Tax=Mytilus galloprovincialis TaxID=29158 RepID=A0A8B6HE25_MYTGA|nr:Hypothetical predicted protein [Mytilus galloprovincialis]
MWSTSAKKTFLRSNIDGDSGVNRSIEGPVATTLHSSEVMSMTMAPVFTTATSSSADDNQVIFQFFKTHLRVVRTMMSLQEMSIS